jgi:DNA topoisomerase-2
MAKEKFDILTPRDHVRLRTAMYLGSVGLEKVERFVKGEWKEVKYVPALNKMLDEILDNSIDEAIRTKFKYANKIKITVKDDLISIEDNGRGIPHDKITDGVTGENILRPIAAWTRTNAGTNFNSERVLIGANGVGAACTNFMSSKFSGKTWHDGKCVSVDCSNGADIIKQKRKTAPSGSGTLVQFTPDFSLIAVDSLEEYDTLALVEDRLLALQIAFPHIAFFFNNKRLRDGQSFKKYSKLFCEDSLTFEKHNIKFFFGSGSDTGHKTSSYINGVQTRLGGTYNDYIINSTIEELHKLIKKKHKIDVSKATIKSGILFVLFANGFKNPSYDSQTKERLTSNITEVKAHYNTAVDFAVIAKKIMSVPAIIEPIVEAQLAKKLAADLRAEKLAQKKIKKIRVPKHIAANKADATLMLVEGDSALGFLLKVRDPDKVGAYPLRGVIMNVLRSSKVDILKNKELTELIAVLGLDITNPDSVDNMNYQNIATLTDQDHDGIGHIMPLLLSFFHHYWPRLFEEGRIHVVRTPIVISNKDKSVEWFYDYESAAKFKASTKSKGYHHRYIKGLASHTEDEYSTIINSPNLEQIVIDDPSMFDMMFGSDVTLRKAFLA